MRAYHFAAVALFLSLLTGCSKRDAAPKVNSSIEGRWVMPRALFMHIEVNLRPDGTYRQIDCAPLAPEDPSAVGVHARLAAYYLDRAALQAQARRGE